MTYTEQQLADLYEKAVSAEGAGDHLTGAGFELDEEMLKLSENYGGLIRSLIDQLRAAGRRPDAEPDEKVIASAVQSLEDDNDPITVPRGLLGAALGAINHPAHAATATIGLLKHYAYSQPKQTAINTGLSWEDYKGISGSPAVVDALDGFTEDATEDNAICLIRAIAEALRPRPRFWVDVHGYQTHLLWSEADAVKHCNETGGLYVLPLFAGEPINCKLPVSMCQLGKLSDIIEVNRLISNLKSLPNQYATPHVALADVLEIIDQLRTPQ